MMRSLCCIFIALVGLSLAQQELSSVVYDNCATATNGAPCIQVELGVGGRDGISLRTPNALPCVLSPDASDVFVSDYRGLTIRSSGSLSNTSENRHLNCPAHVVADRPYGGRFWLSFGALANSDPATVEGCSCTNAGDCHFRTLLIRSSSGSSYNTTAVAISPTGSRGINNFANDVIEAPIVRFNCSGSESSWEWLNGTLNHPNAILLRDTATADTACPLEFSQTLEKWLVNLGYSTMIIARPDVTAYSGVGLSWEAPSLVTLNLIQDDAIAIANEIQAGYSVNVSWGPSFESSEVVSAEVPGGLMSFAPGSGTLEKNASLFEYSFDLLSEGEYGGRSNILWVTGLDADSRSVARVDMSVPSSPAYHLFQSGDPVYQMLPCPMLNSSFLPFRGTGDFPLGCPSVDPNLTSFEFALNNAAFDYGTTFFVEAGQTYAVTRYLVNFPCLTCFFNNQFNFANLDIWDVTNNSPMLIDRLTYDRLAFGDLVGPRQANGLIFFVLLGSAATNQVSWLGVGSAGFSSGMANASSWTDAAVAVDAVAIELRIVDGLLMINWGRDGTQFYNIDANGIVGVNTSIPSGQSGSAGPTAGALTSCGGLSTFIRTNGQLAAAGSAGGSYSSIALETFDVLAAAPGTSTSTSSSTSTSTTSSSGTSSTSSSSSTTGPGQLTPSTTPSPSSSCQTPDVCKYDCSKPADPSKVPKPSVQPSKVPAASKVPEPSFFTVEFSYESTAAECGADAPDCCDVRNWFGDDSVAASFYLCSADSTTKNRAPEFDTKSGTCAVFLAAQEGTDPGQITEAEFQSALTTLEASFATLCPTDVKNCQVNGKSGQSLSSILGSASTLITSSLSFCLMCLFSLALL